MHVRYRDFMLVVANYFCSERKLVLRDLGEDEKEQEVMMIEYVLVKEAEVLRFQESYYMQEEVLKKPDFNAPSASVQYVLSDSF